MSTERVVTSAPTGFRPRRPRNLSLDIAELARQATALLRPDIDIYHDDLERLAVAASRSTRGVATGVLRLLENFGVNALPLPEDELPEVSDGLILRLVEDFRGDGALSRILRLEDLTSQRVLASIDVEGSGAVAGIGGGDKAWLLIPGLPASSISTPPRGGKLEPLARLWRLLKTERSELNVLVVYAAAIGVVALVSPVAAQAVVNTLAFGTLLQPMVILSLLVLFALAIGAVLKLARMVVVERLQRRVFVRVALDLAERITLLRPDAVEKTDRGRYLARFLDVSIVQKALAVLLVDGIALFLGALVGLILVFFYDPIFLAFGLILSILLVLIVALPARTGTRRAVAESYAKYDLATWLMRMGSNQGALFGSAAGWTRTRAEAMTSTWISHREAHFRILFRQSVALQVVYVVAGAGLLLLGGWLVIQERITLGQLVAAEVVIMTVLGSAVRLDKYLEFYYDLLASTDKVGSIIDLPVRQSAAPTTVEGQVFLRIENLSYKTPSASVLAGISLDEQVGPALCVHGPAASGKSTLLRIIDGKLKPSSGIFSFVDEEGFPVQPRILRFDHELPPAHTPREVIQLWSPEADESACRQALRALGASVLIARLEEPLSDSRFASSELTLFELAGALLAQSDVVLVDGLLDDIDEDIAERFLRAFTTDGQQRLLIVASRSATLKKHFRTTLELGGGER